MKLQFAKRKKNAMIKLTFKSWKGIEITRDSVTRCTVLMFKLFIFPAVNCGRCLFIVE